MALAIPIAMLDEPATLLPLPITVEVDPAVVFAVLLIPITVLPPPEAPILFPLPTATALPATTVLPSPIATPFGPLASELYPNAALPVPEAVA
jgi:hypothetical protein